MTDPELIEHMHARGWNVGTIDVPMIREACKALWEQEGKKIYNAWALLKACRHDEALAVLSELIGADFMPQPEASATGAEPVAWEAGGTVYAVNAEPIAQAIADDLIANPAENWHPLCATPTISTTGKVDAARVPLSKEQIDKIWHGMGSFTSNDHRIFARAIEAAHGIGAAKSEGEAAGCAACVTCGQPWPHATEAKTVTLRSALEMARAVLVDIEDYEPNGTTVQVIDAALAAGRGGE